MDLFLDPPLALAHADESFVNTVPRTLKRISSMTMGLVGTCRFRVPAGKLGGRAKDTLSFSCASNQIRFPGSRNDSKGKVRLYMSMYMEVSKHKGP